MSILNVSKSLDELIKGILSKLNPEVIKDLEHKKDSHNVDDGLRNYIHWLINVKGPMNIDQDVILSNVKIKLDTIIQSIHSCKSKEEVKNLRNMSMPHLTQQRVNSKIRKNVNLIKFPQEIFNSIRNAFQAMDESEPGSDRMGSLSRAKASLAVESIKEVLWRSNYLVK